MPLHHLLSKSALFIVGLWAGGRFKSAELVPYIAAQVLGAIAGAERHTAHPTCRASLD